jgi:hypothetical protein
MVTLRSVIPSWVVRSSVVRTTQLGMTELRTTQLRKTQLQKFNNDIIIWSSGIFLCSAFDVQIRCSVFRHCVLGDIQSFVVGSLFDVVSYSTSIHSLLGLSMFGHSTFSRWTTQFYPSFLCRGRTSTVYLVDVIFPANYFLSFCTRQYLREICGIKTFLRELTSCRPSGSANAESAVLEMMPELLQITWDHWCQTLLMPYHRCQRQCCWCHISRRHCWSTLFETVSNLIWHLTLKVLSSENQGGSKLVSNDRYCSSVEALDILF